MTRNPKTRLFVLAMMVGGLAACDRATSTGPLPTSGADFALRSATGGLTAPAARPGPATPARPGIDTARVCRPEDIPGLTEAQIEAIRALYKKFNEEVAADLRYIAQVEQQAREAAAAGAPAERIRQILAQTDAAKAHVAEAAQRLREAIDKILDEGQRARHCVATPLQVERKG